MTLIHRLPSFTGRSATLAACASFALLAACDEGATDEADAITITGSSTVYPFAVKVAEDFVAANEGMAMPEIQQTGSTAGIEEFCKGTGASTVDIVNASRRMTAAEFNRCGINGVSEIIEIKVGRDGIVFVSSTDNGIDLALTPEIIYKALAANPLGEEQTAANWSEVDGSLPGAPIVVYGPPDTSGTRDAFFNLFMDTACEAIPAMAALKESDESAYARNCRAVRGDSAYIAQGEEDDLIVGKVANNPSSIGIFGYSYLEENGDKIRGLSVGGVAPTEETIVDGTYPGSRPLYVYVKKANMDVTPGIKEYIEQWSKSWGAGGVLEAIGLVPASDDIQATSAETVKNLSVLTVAMLTGEESDISVEGEPAAAE